MFKTITDSLYSGFDKDYPDRAFWIDIYTRILNGTFYDHITQPFHEEVDSSGVYIPVHHRRPSVQYGLAKIVADESVSMLFSEGHFPEIDCEDEATRDALDGISKTKSLNLTMIEAATIGSVGSVALFMQVIEGNLYFKACNTQFLTPIYDRKSPETLIKVVEKYKVKGRALRLAGYAIEDDKLDADFWVMREWDANNELVYFPWLVKDKDAKVLIDEEKSSQHNLGFVPVEWIKNLPGGDEIDGACTFKAAIDTAIEIDYQLSMAGRALKYSANPQLVIKNPTTDNQTLEGAGNALIVGTDGDAKLLEINGKAADAVIQYVRHLREMALESVHGNRVNADKVAVAQSGRAMEMLNQPLVWLADRLRISYGEKALVNLLNMVVKASNKMPLFLDGKSLGKLNQNEKITLRWPDWYPPTADDKQRDAVTLKTLKDAGLMSRETAVKTIAADYDVEDVQAELQAIEKEESERIAALKPETKEIINA